MINSLRDLLCHPFHAPTQPCPVLHGQWPRLSSDDSSLTWRKDYYPTRERSVRAAASSSSLHNSCDHITTLRLVFLVVAQIPIAFDSSVVRAKRALSQSSSFSNISLVRTLGSVDASRRTDFFVFSAARDLLGERDWRRMCILPIRMT